MAKSIIGPGQTGTIGAAWSHLHSLLRPKHYIPPNFSKYGGRVSFARANYKGYCIEFYSDRGGWYGVTFIGKRNEKIRRELRKLAGLKT